MLERCARVEPLRYTIRQQDGALVTLTCPNTVHNRQFVDYVKRHEPFGEAQHALTAALEE